VDAVRDPVRIRPDFRASADQAGHQPGHHAGVPSLIFGWRLVRDRRWDVPHLHNAIYRRRTGGQQAYSEAARYDFNWASATGSSCFLAAVVSGLLLGLSPNTAYEDLLAHAGAHALAMAPISLCWAWGM